MGWDNQGDSRCRDILAESQKDYYKVLGVEYDAGEDSIRTNYLRLALKWHPDKHGDADAATLKFQEINEAYRVLSDPVKRYEYDMQGNYALQDYSIAILGLNRTLQRVNLQEGFKNYSLMEEGNVECMVCRII